MICNEGKMRYNSMCDLEIMTRKADNLTAWSHPSLRYSEMRCAMESAKECRICHRILSLDQFHHSKAMPDGHINACKECTAELSKIHREQMRILCAHNNININKKRKKSNREKSFGPKIFSNHYSEDSRERRKALINIFTKNEWETCLKYFDYRCVYCGEKTQSLQKDHYIPVTALACPGTIAENIVPACQSCNSSKSNFEVKKWLRLKFDIEHAENTIDKIELYFKKVRGEVDW